MLAALTIVSLLAAPEDGAVVRWRAPAQCPDAEAVEAAVGAYVGRPLMREAVQAEAEVEASPDGFELTLTIRRGDEADERTLSDPNCAVLADAAALMVAVAIDPDAAAKSLEDLDPLGARTPPEDAASSGDVVPSVEEPPPEVPAATEDSDGAPPSEPEAAPKDDRPRDGGSPPEDGAARGGKSEPRRRDRERRSCRPGPMKGSRPSCVALGASLPLQLGPLPRFGPGLGGDAALLWPRARLELGGAYYFTQQKRLSSDPTRGGDIRLSVGHVRACGRLGWRTVELPLCGGVEAGAMHGQGVGLANPHSDRIPWLAGLADAGFVYSPIRLIALRAQVGAVIPFATYRFRASSVGTIHQASPVGLRLAAGVELRF